MSRPCCRSFVLLILLIIISIGSLVGCGRSIWGHPAMLETRAFAIPGVGGFATYEPYTFSRLSAGNGLYLFTYDIRDMDDTITGLRIWEHRYKKGESEVFVSSGPLPAEYSLPNSGAYLVGVQYDENGRKQKRDIDLEFIMTYHKGKVVYGGRLVLTGAVRGIDVQVEQHFDEDTAPILEYFKGQLKPEEILKIPMEQSFVPIRR